jgi:hypothetical protein
MSYRDAGFEAAAVTHFDVTAECGGAAAQDGPVCLQLLIADAELIAFQEPARRQ